MKIDEPFKQLFTQGMITHKTYKTSEGWVMPKDVLEIDGKLLKKDTRETIKEGPTEKMSKSKKNVIEPDDILENYGIDATRIFMISDSPPDRELEWTDEGIQSSKNLVRRIEKYFTFERTEILEDTRKIVERFIYNIEKNISNFSFNKCIADIYTLFNYLEKNKVYLHDSELSKKILICLKPIVPKMSSNIMRILFKEDNMKYWPTVDSDLLLETNINLPIQVQGKLVTSLDTIKGYKEEEVLKLIYKLDKIKNKIENKKVIKVINVQDKIINIITN